MDYNNNNAKTWNLAQRSRRISKGQAKIFLTRNAADEQKLAKLTQHLDKEKSAKHSEFTYAQKLLLKRYGGKRNSEVDLQRPSRDRSFTWDSTFITKFSEEGHFRADTGWSRDITRAHSLGNVSENEIASGRESLGGQMNNRFQNVSLSDEPLDLDFDNHMTRSPEQRPHAASEILPPITLPPLYKIDDRRSFSKGGTRLSGSTTINKSRAPVPEVAHRTRKVSFKTESTGRKIIMDKNPKNNSIWDRRYLRKSEKE